MIKLVNVCKFLKGFSLNEISFEVKKGEYFVLAGETGAGKSLILSLIYGRIFPDKGKIYKNGSDITTLAMHKRNIGVIFQESTLFPFLDVYENIEFGIKKIFKKSERKEKILQLASKFKIKDLLQKMPSHLSGGEKQKVSLVRTLVLNPDVILLDEPLSSVDVNSRDEIISLLKQIKSPEKAVIHVTHNLEEALSLATKIAIIENGTISQIGTPEEVLRNPKSRFQARFAGYKNFFKGKVYNRNESCLYFVPLGKSLKLEIKKGKAKLTDGETRTIIIPEESIILSKQPFASSARNSFKGKVAEITPLLHKVEVKIKGELDLFTWITFASLETMKIKEGDEIYVSFKAQSVRLI